MDIERCEDDINKFLKSLKYQYVQRIDDIKYVSVERVAITQPFRERGSLRDVIHQEVSSLWCWKSKFGTVKPVLVTTCIN